MFPHDQQLLLNATALPQWFKHIWVGERHKYWMTSTTKTLKKQKQTQKRSRLLRKINFLNENNPGSNTDLQKFCSFPFRKRRVALTGAAQPTLQALCSECEEQELHTNTMPQLCPSRLHEVVFILDYRVSGVSFRSWKIIKQYIQSGSRKLVVQSPLRMY